MDYKAEYDRLRNLPKDSEFWSPEPGQYKVKALSDIEMSDPYKDDEDEKPRRKITILVEGKEHTWTFPFGKDTSAYGQLVHLGSARGKIKDEEFTVIAVGKGQDRRYTIVL
jgi:hypothetical protein